MIKYSWKSILRLTDGDVSLIVLAIKSLCSEYIPKNKNDKLYLYRYHRDFNGDSYLLNPIGLLNSPSLSYHICEYVYLASFRSYSNYILTGSKTLDMFLSPIKDEQKLKQNPLLDVRTDKIIFKYEEL